MTTYNTGNPIGSTDARDRLDNTENMDILENSTTLDAHPDRLGVLRKTRKGMELEHNNQISAHESEHDAQIAAHESEHDAQMQAFESDFDGRLAGMAFTRVGSFTTGATLTDMRQTLLWEVSQGGDGHEYGWTGSFLPSGKVVAAGSTPATSGGVGAGAWVDRTDLTLRSEISDIDGAGLIGLATYAQIRAYNGGAARINCIGRANIFDGAGGLFAVDATDTTSADNDGTILVDALGRRWKRVYHNRVVLSWFGTKGDGLTDDTAAIQAAANARSINEWLDGEGLTYLINGKITSTKDTFLLQNANFVTPTDYVLSQFAITTTITKLRDVTVDGGRGTYKAGYEPWTKFSSYFGVDSIQPTIAAFFAITAYSTNAVTHVDRVHFSNIFATDCITVRSPGRVYINDCNYTNIANRTFLVDHRDSEGVRGGDTFADNLFAKDVGLLPDQFYVGGVLKDFATANAAPQGSFNFQVSYGNYTISNATVVNYGSTAVCPNECNTFTGTNLSVYCNTVRAFSNNPPGAIWNESCVNYTLENVYIEIMARDPRELSWDSCALLLFSMNGESCLVNNLKIVTSDTTPVFKKFIRAVTKYMSAYIITNFNFIGKSSTNVAISIFGEQDNAPLHTVKIARGKAEHGLITVNQPYHCTIDDVTLLDGSVNVGTTSAPNQTITSCSASVTNSYSSGGVTVNAKSLDKVRVSDNSYIGGSILIGASGAGNEAQYAYACNNQHVEGGVTIYSAVVGDASHNGHVKNDISITSDTGRMVAIGNKNCLGKIGMAGVNLPVAAQAVIANNAHVSGTISSKLREVQLTGNATERRSDIIDVQMFTVTGNTIKTNGSEPILWIRRTDPENIITLAGMITGNNFILHTTAGAADYVIIDSGITGVTDVNNNKVKVDYILPE